MEVIAIRCNACKARASDACYKAKTTCSNGLGGISWSTSHNRLAPPSTNIMTNGGSDKSRSLRFCQLKIGWYALHAFHPLHHQLQAPKRIHGPEILYVWQNQRSIWPYYALQATHDPWHREWHAIVQGFSNQPPRLGSFMVPPLSNEFRE